MALRFYINGTTGGTDGIEISNGSGLTPLVFDGMYPGVANVTIYRTIHIRADAGEEWRDVNIMLKSSIATSDANIRVALYPSWSSNTSSVAYYYPWIGDVNKFITLKSWATPTDTGSPDINCDICANGWRSV